MSEHTEMDERAAEHDDVRSPVTDQTESDGNFVLRDARYGSGGGVPGVNPDDWMSIKHLVRGAGA